MFLLLSEKTEKYEILECENRGLSFSNSCWSEITCFLTVLVDPIHDHPLPSQEEPHPHLFLIVREVHPLLRTCPRGQHQTFHPDQLQMLHKDSVHLMPQQWPTWWGLMYLPFQRKLSARWHSFRCCESNMQSLACSVFEMIPSLVYMNKGQDIPWDTILVWFFLNHICFIFGAVFYLWIKFNLFLCVPKYLIILFRMWSAFIM